MANTPQTRLQGNRGRDVSVERLDPAKLSQNHEWMLTPAVGRTFRNTIELCNDPRTDISRFKLIASNNKEKAMNLFSTLCMSETMFKVPDTIQCDRTWTRDKEEAYYLDAMDAYLHRLPEDLDVRDIPFLQQRTHDRLFCSFVRKPGYRSELFERRRLGIWLPYDCLENKPFGDAELSAFYPRTEDWVKGLYVPPAMTVPVPFVIYYYHKELRDAQVDPDRADSERIRRLRFCLQKEFYILFMAMWWNDVYHGGRAYVLENAAIQVLDTHCGTIPQIAGKPAQAIIEHMRMASQLPESYHNWACFRDQCMEASAFIWCIKMHGGLDSNMPAGQRKWCDRIERKITNSRYGSSLFKRVSTMDSRLTIPDLDKIEGLLGLVRGEEWDARGSLRVGDILYQFMNLYRRTLCRAEGAERDLDSMRRELDCVRQELHDKDQKLRDTERRLDSAQYRLEDEERRLRYNQRHLDETRSRLHEISRSRPTALRSAPHTPQEITRVGNRSVETREARTQDTRSHPLVDTAEEQDPRSPHYSPPRRDDVAASRRDAAAAVLPIEGDGNQTSTPTTPAQAKDKHIPSGSLFYRRTASGNVPWSAKKVLQKRPHSAMAEGTTYTRVETGTGTESTNTPIAVVHPATGSDAQSSAGPSAKKKLRSTDLSRDPILARLLSRHPRNTALALSEKPRAGEKNGAEKEKNKS